MAIVFRDFFLPFFKPKFVEFAHTVLLIEHEQTVIDYVKEALVDQRDMHFFACLYGKQAIETALSIKPTLIILDIDIPDCNGLKLIKQIRAHPFTRDVPVIVFASVDNQRDREQVFKVGGNDYLLKVPDFYELIAKVRYHSVNYIRFLQRNEAYKQLEEHDNVLHNDLIEAAAYVSSLLPEPLRDGVDVDWVFIPSAYLGGDHFDYFHNTDTMFSFDLVDVCGHGVGAALLSVSILNYIRSIPYSNDLKLSSVMSQINQAFPMEKNNKMFFSLWGGIYNMLTRKLYFTSGGHPPAILVREGKAIELTAGGLMLGVDSEALYNSKEIDIQPNDILYLFSDGIYEIDNKQGVQLGLKKFIQLLEQLSLDDPLDKIVDQAKAWREGENFEDDVSLMRLKFH